jgi:leader peptidase (prepilin peptidase)/N-methyltransferase
VIDAHPVISLAQQAQLWWWYLHAPIALFVFCFGACVGSFMNVVIYRLPEGISVISPPSRCPTCGVRLTWHENLPIFGWLLVRGRCRSCGVRISPQYVLVELTMALVFLGFYILLFMVSPQAGWWGQIGGTWWSAGGFPHAWPSYVALMFLLSGLLAMTVIDARTFTIPIQIPTVITLVAFAAYVLQAILPPSRGAGSFWPIHTTDWRWFAVAVGGMAGIVGSFILLKAGKFRYSFADYGDYVEEGQTLGNYPHARREMKHELLYLLPCVIGLVAGYAIGGYLPRTGPPVLVQSLGGTLLGYLVGGGLVWGIRIGGTLGFGREAMGLGDVHLLGAVGAALGWIDATWVFFIAPFFGLGWVFVSMGLGTVFKRLRRELPYGPHLAAATLAVVLCRPAIMWVQSTYLPMLPKPMLTRSLWP